MEQCPSEANSHSVKKFPALNGLQRFNILFTRVPHWSLSCTRYIQSTPSHRTSLRSTLILSPHLCLQLPSDIFLSDFPTKILYAFLLSHVCYMPCPSHPPWFDHPNNTWRSAQVTKLLTMQSSPASSLVTLPNTPSTLFSNTLNVCKIWGFHGSEDSSQGLLGCNVV